MSLLYADCPWASAPQEVIYQNMEDGSVGMSSAFIGACPLCRTPGATLAASLTELDVALCQRCGTGFVARLRSADARRDDEYSRTYEAERVPGKPEACWSLLVRHAGGTDGVSRVLDVGCGQGGFLDRARAAGLQTAGLDASPAAVAAARERGFDVRLASAAAHPFEDEPPFDLITMWDVLEHLEDPRAALTGCLHRLAPGGRLVVLTPAMGSVFDRVGLAIYRAAGPRADRLLRMCWSAQHLLRFEPGGLCAVLRDLGFAGARSRRVQVLSLHDSHYAGSAIMPAWSRSSRVNRAISRAGVALARVLHVTNKVLVTAETPRHVH